MKPDALLQLAHGLVAQLLVQLWLAEHDDLEQLALLRFQVRQQAQRLQRLERHGLRFVQAYDDAFARPGEFEQGEVQRLEQRMLVVVAVEIDAQLLGQREQQAVRIEQRIRQVGGYVLVVELGQEAPARRVGFAIRETAAANLTGDGLALFDAAVTYALSN